MFWNAHSVHGHAHSFHGGGDGGLVVVVLLGMLVVIILSRAKNDELRWVFFEPPLVVRIGVKHIPLCALRPCYV